ncbi:DgaE family pyridoxal phosphate-dependent ammonia lyase [Virgibacillus sp. M23]|uniref:DgaE family pyridoxal phosphate-dependent ammonia lyase n=1 Tax=Virgibacillus sp. M23 TaxID=3079030 RepID=UPI002A91034A|nr:DgaE family pyridoxal phosphate-dependent ammonia lyase [Virgibacillus sp. M23]MDY7043217.1 DgaE family pyridoxal phosphate-dependent ammonia lyase [Virgibacillus sp. M23]
MERTLHANYGLKRVINASGRMSILGVSAPTDSVMEAMKQGGQNYVEMADLVNKSGDYVANHLASEAAVIVNSASSGIVLSVAGLITEGNRRKSDRLHQEPIEKNEVILLKGHNVHYGAPIETMVYLGGGTVVEAGYANEGNAEHIREAISSKTAAILYVQSHHAVQKNILSVEEAYQVAQEKQIPFIVDAAAEGALQKYINYADVVIYSGSKAIEGPTSGIVAGRRKYIEWIKVQLHGIGRSMKVGKESIFGLLKALDEYANKPDNSLLQKEVLTELEDLNHISGITVTVVQDEAGRAIYRARIQIDANIASISAKKLTQQLRNGNIAIYTRDYGANQGFFDIDPRSLKNDDIHIIKESIKTYVGGM